MRAKHFWLLVEIILKKVFDKVIDYPNIFGDRQSFCGILVYIEANKRTIIFRLREIFFVIKQQPSNYNLYYWIFSIFFFYKLERFETRNRMKIFNTFEEILHLIY